MQITQEVNRATPEVIQEIRVAMPEPVQEIRGPVQAVVLLQLQYKFPINGIMAQDSN
uniref:Uncharacterized protein n=1 Tax=Meloidogyne enterolobii TaxID=390850 RepID=A0A6V7XQB9_MELEN|nr:unnamed protein product [Meloidogyne enterolobii]